MVTLFASLACKNARIKYEKSLLQDVKISSAYFTAKKEDVK